jgi:hypothetical protein
MMNEVRATEFTSSRQGIFETIASGIPQFLAFHKPERHRGRRRAPASRPDFDRKTG